MLTRDSFCTLAATVERAVDTQFSCDCEVSLRTDPTDASREALVLPVLGNRAIVIIYECGDRRSDRAEIATLRNRSQALTRVVQLAREDERRRLASEVHDQFGQSLTLLKFDLARLVRESKEHHRFPASELRGALTQIDEMIEGIRDIAAELRPRILEDVGLVAALKWQLNRFQARTGILCRPSLPETEPKLDSFQTIGLFRIFQETLTNIARHADASEVTVTLYLDDKWIVLEIADNGCGLNPEANGLDQHIGLVGMSERAEALGGEITITSPEECGTRVMARVLRRAGYDWPHAE
jgi:signal transduction histidine kinase